MAVPDSYVDPCDLFILHITAYAFTMRLSLSLLLLLHLLLLWSSELYDFQCYSFFIDPIEPYLYAT